MILSYFLIQTKNYINSIFQIQPIATKNMKKAISATIDDSLIRWMEKELGASAKYRNKSHLIESALIRLKEEVEH
jgi:hypothetical protein